MRPIFQFVHDTRRKKSNGKYPIKIRVTFQRIQKYYPTGFDLSEEEFVNVFALKVKSGLLPIRIKLDAQIKELREKSESVTNFSFGQLDRITKEKAKSVHDIFPFFEEVIREKTANGKIKTALTYSTAQASFKKFQKKIGFYDVTPKFLIDYERNLLQDGYSSTTVGFNIRNLRAIYNIALSKGVITDVNAYPFKKSRYSIPKGRNVKKALTVDEIELIANITTFESEKENWARDMWIFSYLANGLNPSDIFRLKKTNIDEDYISLSRKKTEATSDSLPIVIYLREELKLIIEKWGNKFSLYIFDGIADEMSEEQKVKVVDQKIKMINRYMGKLSVRIGINKKILTYDARHSYASVLKGNGESIEVISEALGHSSTKTTRAYLNSFRREVMKNASDKLLK